MQKLFISDLHLSEQHPRLIRGFFSLLKKYRHEPTELYILGDWFNAWLSDGDPSEWLLPIVQQLREFTVQGNQVYFLCGNRDFVLGQDFLDRFGGKLIKEPYILQWHHDLSEDDLIKNHLNNNQFENKKILNIRLEHGDSLCTDDISYQRFKKVVRNPIVLGLLKCLPFYLKKKLGEFFRKKSKSRQQQQYYQPIDVNEQAVAEALNNVDILIHGHTHRPEIHHYPQHKQRIVLGDWRENSGIGIAKILLLKHRDILFFDWEFE